MTLFRLKRTVSGRNILRKFLCDLSYKLEFAEQGFKKEMYCIFKLMLNYQKKKITKGV